MFKPQHREGHELKKDNGNSHEERLECYMESEETEESGILINFNQLLLNIF